MNPELLISILAAVDAIYRPFRGPWLPVSSVPTVLYERRKEYPVTGLRWLSGEAAEAKRKQAQRDLEDLAGERLVEVFRARGKAIGVKLTELGDQTARALAGLPNVDEAFEAMLGLIALHNAKHRVAGYGNLWVPEFLFTGVPWGDPRNDSRGENLLGHLQEMLIPALSRGWLDFLSSVHGHGWYTITVQGTAAAQEPAYGELLPALPECDESLRQLYDQEYSAALTRLYESAPDVPSELGMIPLPVSFCLESQREAPADA